DGNAVAIQNSTGNSTNSWQTAPAVGQTVDTGRGLSFTFTGNLGVSTALNYTAAGISFRVEKTDTLADVANKFNSSLQPEGNETVASIIGNQLVLTAANTGENHQMMITDGAGFALDEKQKAQNAKLTVNNIDLVRQSNNNLTDVVYGVSLNLSADAVGADGTGKSATLNVVSNNDAAQSSIDTFITKFNNLEDYIAERSAVTKVDDTTFNRGPLADDSSFSELRTNMLFGLMERVNTTGKYSSLADIGITIDDNLKVTISDSAKLTQAMQDNPDDVTKIMDNIFGKLDTQLSAFGGTSGYLSAAVTNLNNNISDLGTDITNLTDQLNTRQSNLVSQYADIQTELMTLSYTQQTLNSFYGTSNSLS
ncbi:MAG TPA: flagellar filament capping protein FliD, partial [Leptolinea sp.]